MTTIAQPTYAPRYAPQRPMAGAHRPAAPHIRPVPPVRALPTIAPRTRIGALVTWRNIAVVVIAIVALSGLRLLISVGTDANAYTIAAKAKESVNLARDAQFIQEQLNVLNSPQHLSTIASAMGMISNSSPAYLRISDGKVWGNPHVVGGGTIDRISIANVLEKTLISGGVAQGVASETPAVSTADSKTSTTTSPSSGIPAPDTH